MSETRGLYERFVLGDRVRVREWEDMAEEFGVVEDEIQCDAGFVPKMRHLCGKEFTICDPETVKSIEGNVVNYAHGVEGFERAGWSGRQWIITESMIEHVQEDTLDDTDGVEDITSILSVRR